MTGIVCFSIVTVLDCLQGCLWYCSWFVTLCNWLKIAENKPQWSFHFSVIDGCGVHSDIWCPFFWWSMHGFTSHIIMLLNCTQTSRYKEKLGFQEWNKGGRLLTADIATSGHVIPEWLQAEVYPLVYLFYFHCFTDTHAELQRWWGTKKIRQYTIRSDLKDKWQSLPKAYNNYILI